MFVYGARTTFPNEANPVASSSNFLPDNQHIVYGSTHLAADACPPDADRSKGYVWAVYPGYDVILAKDDGTDPRQLTSAPGYDAEATINAKTKKIIYTSMASGRK